MLNFFQFGPVDLLTWAGARQLWLDDSLHLLQLHTRQQQQQQQQDWFRFERDFQCRQAECQRVQKGRQQKFLRELHRFLPKEEWVPHQKTNERLHGLGKSRKEETCRRISRRPQRGPQQNAGYVFCDAIFKCFQSDDFDFTCFYSWVSESLQQIRRIFVHCEWESIHLNNRLSKYHDLVNCDFLFWKLSRSSKVLKEIGHKRCSLSSLFYQFYSLPN